MSLQGGAAGARGGARGSRCAFAADCVGAEAEAAVAALPAGGVLLLENTRFHKGEEANDPEFAAALAALGDVYCNDAFSAAHRAHASTEGLARLLPSCAGRLMQAELEALEKALGRSGAAGGGGGRRRQGLDQARAARQPDRQGRHAGDRRGHGEHLPRRAGDRRRQVALRARPGRRPRARSWRRPKAAGCAILLPADVVVAREFKAGAAHEIVPANACPPDAMILDAGPAAIAAIAAAFAEARTLVWNGPLGAFEIPPFNAATDAAARQAASLTRAGQAPVGGGRRRHGGGAQRQRRRRRPSPMSRPPAARFSNGSRARPCPGSRRWKRLEINRRS